ncbi:T7SS effector LXG polymorphic toxin [Bacillus sp. FSL W7-1360]
MKFLDVNKHLGELDEHIAALKSYLDVFEATEARITLVVNTDGAFKGEGSQGIINNHQYVHLPTIRSIRAGIAVFIEKLEKIKEQINSFEPESNGSVSEDFWKTQLPNAYDSYEETLEGREKNVNNAVAEVSHILNLGKLQTEGVYNSLDSARKHTETVLEGLYDLDQTGVELMAEVRTEMAELKATIAQVLQWTLTGGVKMSGVSIMEVGGYFSNNATLHEKAPEVDTSKVTTGADAAALMDNPALMDDSSLWQQTADFFETASSGMNYYTMYNFAQKSAGRYTSPISNEISRHQRKQRFDKQMAEGRKALEDKLRKNRGATPPKSSTLFKSGASLVGKMGAKAIPIAGTAITLGDNAAEFVREENNGKTVMQKTGRFVGGTALEVVVPWALTPVGGPLWAPAAIATINLGTDNWLTDSARDVGEAIFGGIENGAKAGWDIGTAVIDDLTQGAKSSWELTKTVGEGAKDVGTAIVDDLTQGAKSSWELTKSVGEGAKDVGTAIIDDLTKGIKSSGDFLFGWVR